MRNNPAENETETPRKLLPGFYSQYGLNDDGGQSSRYVKIEFTKKFRLYFPNFDARRKAVFKHDVHHIATGYTSTFEGETEIGAWEIASGCRHYWVAFALDLHAMMIGILFNPVGVYRAFIKGRRTRNLYRDAFSDKQLMDTPLVEIQKYMLLDNYPGKKKGNGIDLVLFLLTALLGTIYSLLSLVLLPFIIIYTLFIIAQKK
ncbi:MAG: hypothetical protein Q8941_13755 [Bacteroidota bacterium]|nr:hypothetical protein [Bacteroidota bacterium]